MANGGHQDQQNAMRQYIMHRPQGEPLSLRKRLSRLEAVDQLRQAGRSPTIPLEFTSQYGEDCWLWELFEGQHDGFFIEVGAYDGYTLSVTYAFESLGWKGLLIEPIPDRFELAKARRPGSRVVNAALAGPGSSGTCTFTVVGSGDYGMLSFLTPTPLNVAEVKNTGQPTQSVTVPMTSMDALLAGHTGPIDFAVIDVEGGEIPLLQGFDLLRFRPRVLMIEEGLAAPVSPVSQYLAKFPYTAIAYPWINRVYIRNDETALLQRAARIPVW